MPAAKVFSNAMPDLAAGEKLFVKTCAACHKLGEQGKKIGPELDGIAHRGLDRLLEDLFDPSRNVDQAFRSTAIATSDGRAISGLVLREEGQVLVLADPQGKELRVPLAEIDTRSRLAPFADAGQLDRRPERAGLLSPAGIPAPAASKTDAVA